MDFPREGASEPSRRIHRTRYYTGLNWAPGSATTGAMTWEESRLAAQRKTTEPVIRTLTTGAA